MPNIDKENKTIVFSIGDSNRQTHYADVAIPFDTYNELEEDELFNRERKAFLNLAKTQPTLQRISSLIEKGISIRN